MAAISINDLTTGTLEGTGVFDELMRTVGAHIHEEYSKNRIKGPEYSTVYLGAIQSVMDRSLQFLLEKERTDLQAQLLQAQIANAQKEGLLLDKQTLKLDSEIALVDAQTANTVAEGLNIPKQGELMDEQIASEQKRNELNGLLDQEKSRLIAQTAQIEQQTSNLTAEALNIPKQGELIDAQIAQSTAENLRIAAQTSQVEQQTTNLTAEGLNIPKQGLLLDQQVAQSEKEVLLVQEKIESEEKNNMLDGVIDKQICKLNGEFDLLAQQTLKAAEEIGVLAQKKITEQAQTSGTGVDADSVIGKQKTLYTHQADGFLRDAEQKGARLLLDTWNTQRMTDETGTQASIDNGLYDPNIKRAVDKVLDGINA